MKKLLYYLVPLILIGCVAPPKPTFEKMSESLATNKSSATREYKGKSPKEVLEASHKALYMLDPGYDMEFDLTTDKLFAKRAWVVYLVVWSTLGLDQYNVSVEKIPNGTKSMLAFGSDSLPIIWPPNSFKKDLDVGYMENPADFKLFHDRVEYLLGMRKDWVTCDAAKAKQPDPKKEMFLCDSVGLENISPEDQLAKDFK